DHHPVALLEDVERQERAREQHRPQREHRRQLPTSAHGPRTAGSGPCGYCASALPTRSSSARPAASRGSPLTSNENTSRAPCSASTHPLKPETPSSEPVFARRR